MFFCYKSYFFPRLGSLVCNHFIKGNKYDLLQENQIIFPKQAEFVYFPSVKSNFFPEEYEFVYFHSRKSNFFPNKKEK